MVSNPLPIETIKKVCGIIPIIVAKKKFLTLTLKRVGKIQLSCILPTLFNVKVRNFFLATIIGIIPQTFLIVSIGSGLETIIQKNLEPPKIMDIISSPNIYWPLIIFIFLVIITIFLRKLFYKK